MHTDSFRINASCHPGWRCKYYFCCHRALWRVIFYKYWAKGHNWNEGMRNDLLWFHNWAEGKGLLSLQQTTNLSRFYPAYYRNSQSLTQRLLTFLSLSGHSFTCYTLHVTRSWFLPWKPDSLSFLFPFVNKKEPTRFLRSNVTFN